MAGEQPSIRVPIALRWRDMDMLGHLNQAVYHELLEEGRSALFESLRDEGEGFAFVLAHVELDHHREVRRDAGTVEVVVRVAEVGRSSITVEHDIVLPGGELAASGRSVLVAWDLAARGARALADHERSVLSAEG